MIAETGISDKGVRVRFRRSTKGPLLQFPGQKWGIAKWVIEHLPAHDGYIEPYFGSGAVLLSKEPSRSELVNDIDGNLVAFFRVLRDRPDDLARALYLTPYARDELLLAKRDDDVDDLERARRLAIRSWQTRGGAQDRLKPAFRFDLYGAARKSLAHSWGDIPDRVLAAAARFREVAIENKPALDIIRLAGKRGARNLIYADPPYLGSIDQRLYDHSMTSDDHQCLLTALSDHPGPVVLSGYHSELYDALLASWTAVERSTRNQTNAKRVEVIWLNPVAASQMSFRHLGF